MVGEAVLRRAVAVWTLVAVAVGAGTASPAGSLDEPRVFLFCEIRKLFSETGYTSPPFYNICNSKFILSQTFLSFFEFI